MAFVLNLIWFILGGLVLCITWFLGGLIMCITVIGIPFGVACFRIAGFIAFPFGKDIIDARLLGEKRITGTALMNFLWIVLAGIWLAISHAIAAVLCFITIIGIPLAVIHARMARVSFAPLGKRIVIKSEVREAIKYNTRAKIEKRKKA
ncbi:Inner membrane protein YccF [Limihaloglobus sulfuriphilus]|uniref:Inner membrane protein YccF n=1 Tax=Limihaloglobus sulfuriphilus TaxID=1851148 RepID=A0A1Q2MIJ3_9BACT|nr:YccF domain-containing protein [Limihaloglobus sulfuriphilus]AQQ72535.1 Inner membrane protein YccF [Limihaloglobus sulfuriphilus]